MATSQVDLPIECNRTKLQLRVAYARAAPRCADIRTPFTPAYVLSCDKLARLCGNVSLVSIAVTASGRAQRT